MSTNYYIISDKDEIHIGKRVGIGGGQCGFNWAIPPENLDQIFSRMDPDIPFGREIVNEYGDSYTLERFKEVVAACESEDFGFVGREFSSRRDRIADAFVGPEGDSIIMVKHKGEDFFLEKVKNEPVTWGLTKERGKAKFFAEHQQSLMNEMVNKLMKQFEDVEPKYMGRTGSLTPWQSSSPFEDEWKNTQSSLIKKMQRAFRDPNDPFLKHVSMWGYPQEISITTEPESRFTAKEIAQEMARILRKGGWDFGPSGSQGWAATDNELDALVWRPMARRDP